MPALTPAAAPRPAWPAPGPGPATAPGNVQGQGQFGILFVCTGNVCRSVLAERLALRGLHARLGAGARRFRVASAGTASLAGGPVHPYTAEALTWLGADAEGFASRELTAADVDAADVVLTAGREHRDQVLALRPAASRRAYLIREFARLAAFASAAAAGGPAISSPPVGSPTAASPPADLAAVQQARDLVAEVALLRGRAPYVEPGTDEIPDPAATQQAFLDCAAAIDELVGEILDLLCQGLPSKAYQGRHAR